MFELVNLKVTIFFIQPSSLFLQAGSLECLQWLVEEAKVPFQVRDTGGETLMHHAAFYGQVCEGGCVSSLYCLVWLFTLLSLRAYNLTNFKTKTCI